MTTQTHEEKSSKTVKEVPPAGGTDASQALMALLEKAGSAIDAEKASKRTYGQKALDVAIPTTIVAVACVATYAGVTLVYRQWGRGALISRGMDLIEAGKLNVLDAVGQAAGQTAGHTPQHQMM